MLLYVFVHWADARKERLHERHTYVSCGTFQDEGQNNHIYGYYNNLIMLIYKSFFDDMVSFNDGYEG